MFNFIKPCWEIIIDSAKGLSEADLLAPLLVDSAAAFSLMGFVLVIGLLCTLGKSHGMRWGAFTSLVLAAGAAYGGYHFTNELVSARDVSAAQDDFTSLIGHQVTILKWYWIAPIGSALVLLITLASSKKLRGLAILLAILCATATAGGTLIAASTQHRVLTDAQWDALSVSSKPAQSDEANDSDSDEDETAPTGDGDTESGDDEGANLFGVPVE